MSVDEGYHRDFSLSLWNQGLQVERGIALSAFHGSDTFA